MSLVEAKAIWRKHCRAAAEIRRARRSVPQGTAAFSGLTKALELERTAADKWHDVVSALEEQSRTLHRLKKS